MRPVPRTSLVHAKREWCIAKTAFALPNFDGKRLGDAGITRTRDTAGVSPTWRLLCSLTKQDHADGFREDQHIENQRVVLDVEKIELQLALRVLN